MQQRHPKVPTLKPTRGNIIRTPVYATVTQDRLRRMRTAWFVIGSVAGLVLGVAVSALIAPGSTTTTQQAAVVTQPAPIEKAPAPAATPQAEQKPAQPMHVNE